MINVRVFVSNTYPMDGDKLIWHGDVRPNNEKKYLSKFKCAKENSLMQGEMVAYKFSNGKGSGCKIEGSLLGIDILDIGTSHQIDLYISAGNWRTW